MEQKPLVVDSHIPCPTHKHAFCVSRAMGRAAGFWMGWKDKIMYVEPSPPPQSGDTLHQETDNLIASGTPEKLATKILQLQV